MNTRFFDAHQDIMDALPGRNGKSQTSFNDLPKSCCFVVASIFVAPETHNDNNDYRAEITKQLNTCLAAIETNRLLFLVRTKKDLSAGRQKTGVIIHLEGLTTLSRKDIPFIYKLADKGVRSFGLTWNQDNDFAGSCVGAPSRGLTKLGKDFVRFCLGNNLVVDIAHASKQTIDDCLSFGKPIVYSHGGCDSILKHVRNIGDGHIKAISQAGGGVGIFAVGKFLTNKPSGRLTDFFKHIKHALAVAGPNAIGLGTDLGGMFDYDLMTGAENMPDIQTALVAWKMSAIIKNKIAYSNWLAVYRRIL
ncbi:MAG: membrane dipeptidase [Parcubacteria group bacterium]|nr:membrane dipeptidase [Parcubacteria group bacterium]